MNMFEIGDKVEIVNYGQLSWTHREIPQFKVHKKIGTMFCYDVMPELVGMKGKILHKAKCKCGSWDYSIQFDNGEIKQWFKPSQLKKL